MIDPRLLSAASFVRAGAVLADIGTDHGYLPVFLLLKGRISRAVLCDINSGPLSSAEANVCAAGVGDKCELLLCDGAAMLDGRGITDYAICGMGGGLIADIIKRAPHLCNTGIRLILQPMTRQEHLRRELYRLGFAIVSERYSTSDGKYYVCMAVEYNGTPCEISDRAALLGLEDEHSEDREEYLAYLSLKRRSAHRAASGMQRAGRENSALLSVLDILEEEIARINGIK